jgi:peptide/nickel transport system substrate-binding protein
MIRSLCFFSIFAFLIFAGCTTDVQQKEEDFQITIRLPNEPDNLHPMFSRSAYATQIENLILYPLAEFDPFSLELSPLIIETVPKGQFQSGGPSDGQYRYDLKIREEATWEDGIPITAQDYLFSLKAAFNPKVNAPSWRGYFQDMKTVELDQEDSKKLSVYLEGKNMLSDLIVVNFNIFPKHIYDPEGLMEHLTLDEIRNPSNQDSLLINHPELEKFATAFSGVQYNREIISGAGPYKMVEWVTGESITLEKKENWWGGKVANRPPMMNGFPQRIKYSFVPDENTALTAVKDGSFDVISEVSSDAFLNLKNDPNYAEVLDFFTPSVMQYHYLELNNRNPKLSDVRVRKALAYLLDYDALIENLTSGLSMKTIGPVHPSKVYYNQDIQPIKQDIEKSKQLLTEAGWSDTNGNGTVDKVIDGQLTELDLSVIVSQRREGQQLALILKQNAAQAGINILIENRPLSQAIRNRDFEIVPMRRRSNPYVYDPHQAWHSMSDQPGGGNYTGYRDAEADKIIDAINDEENAEKRNELYRELQAELIHDQPVIFLYVPLEKVIVNKRLKAQPSARRPGYFENLFELN